MLFEGQRHGEPGSAVVDDLRTCEETMPGISNNSSDHWEQMLGEIPII
jgi:hypothetical protein